jgi:hypothetical protein
MDSAVGTSSNSKLSLPSSSSVFPNPSTQNNINRKEEPEIYHNSEGDIAD